MHMQALLMWLDGENKRHYGRVINIVDSTLTVKDITTGEEVTFFYPNEHKILH